jgi:hypothetical protein
VSLARVEVMKTRIRLNNDLNRRIVPGDLKQGSGS